MHMKTVSAVRIASLAMLIVIIAAVLFAVRAGAVETESIPSTDDTKIVEATPDQNFGDAASLVSDASKPSGSGKAQSALIKWDLSRIAPGTSVDSASVILTVKNPSPESTFEAYALERHWVESEATWNAFATGEPWEVAGARGSLDTRAQPVGTITPSEAGEQTLALSPEVVQRWVDDPSTNKGIILSDSSNRNGFAFYSGEADTTSLRPRLVVGLSSAPLPQDDPVMVGAGDISTCTNDNDEATAKLLDGIPGTVFTVGDNVYDGSTAEQFNDCYAPTWGRHKARTKPSVGNHEYDTPGASGYFGYFGAAAGDPNKGYYSYDRGEWHVVALNSMCEEVGGCGPNSPMVGWLKQDLAANEDKACTLAYFHHPRFSSSKHGDQTHMGPTWDALYAANADVVVSGHDHLYERFAPQRPDGTLDPERGIRQFVVGTGGASHYAVENPQPNSEVRNSDTYGVLRLTLSPGTYGWKFVPVEGKTFTDSGRQSCH
jgi:hypothetical protein